MTKAEFFKALPRTGWHLTPDYGLLRTVRGQQCPITCVAKLVMGRDFSVTMPSVAVEALGLRHDFADHLMDAADGFPCALRTRLLKHTHIRENDAA
jgi:hypothetical protein